MSLINYILNPSFEYGVAATGNESLTAGSTKAQSETSPAVGQVCLKVKTTAGTSNEGVSMSLGTLPAGTYVCQAQVRAGTVGTELEIFSTNAANETSATQKVTLGGAGVWQTVTWEWTTAALSVTPHLVFRHAPATAVEFFLDAVAVIPSPGSAYFDGASAGFYWAGTAGNSVSVQHGAFLPNGPQLSVKYTLLGPNGTIATFNDSSDINYVGSITEVTGLESAEVRQSGENLVGMDGGINGNFYYGRRPITLTGLIYNVTSNEDRNLKITKLLQASDAMREDAILTWTPAGGEASYVKVRRAQPLRVSGGWAKDFQLALIAADHRIYSLETEVATIAANTSKELINTGSETSYPILKISGKPEIFGVENQTTGEVINFEWDPTVPNQTFAVVPSGTAMLAISGARLLFGVKGTKEIGSIEFQGPRIIAKTLNYQTFAHPLTNISTDGAGGAYASSYKDSEIMVHKLGSLAGKSENLLAPTKAPRGMAYLGGYVYWIEDGTTLGKVGVARSKTVTPSQEIISENFLPVGSVLSPNLCVVGKYIYVASPASNAIYRFPVPGEGGEAAGSLIAGCHEPVGITATATKLYWTNNSTNTIGTALLAGTSVNQEWAAGCNNPIGITNDGTWVYWANSGNGTIGRNLIVPEATTITIDLNNRTATTPTDSIYSGIDFTHTDWWGLLPGYNIIKLIQTAEEEALSLVVEWQNAWV